MYFKSLEVVGFKSFLNKTKLKFEPGVTAIVGPNGCGKSNIVDAIKWVLGEQSTKSMRSSSMQDVIFSGTDKYDPVNVAQVSLTLSNEDRALPVDYDEVTISRRLYRSGESEYLLNKTPVRLADVRSLIMGTGIGTSSYSIVEQGKMDMILSSKPEERRYIFEEASGITRYKTKKREALLKLERTKENLLRINDIIREVERQIKSIERQARKAERYKAYYEELKSLDIKLAYKRFRGLGTDDVSLDAEGDEVKMRSERLGSDLEKASESLIQKREEFNAVFTQLQEAQSEVVRLSSDIDKNKHVTRVNSERITELERGIERLNLEIDEVLKHKDGLQVRLESLEVRFRDASSQRSDKDEALRCGEENVKELTAILERRREELRINKERIVDVAAGQTKARNSLIKVNADIQNAQARQKRLKLERESVHREKESLGEELKSVEEKASLMEKALNEKKTEYRIFNDEYVTKQEKLAALSGERRQEEKALNEIKPRRQFLQKLIEEREGVNESAKEIIKRLEMGDERFQGVRGVLSEIVNVRSDYEESLGFVLGEAAQALVVENREVAGRVIAHLEENSMESASFIILDELAGPPAGEAGGAMKDVTHIISSQEPYRSALKALLGGTFVADSREEAESAISRGGRIIREKGEVYQRGMHRSRNFSSKEAIPLFGRQEKVKEMLEEEERITSQIKELEELITGLEIWLKESAVKKDRLEGELRQKEMEFSDISNRKTSVKDKFNSLAEELLLLNTEIEEEALAINELHEEKETLERGLEEFEGENSRLEALIEELQNGIQDARRKREETLFCMSDIKAELYALRKEEENLAENLEREKTSYSGINQSIEERHLRINENRMRMNSLEEEMVSVKERDLEYIALVEIRRDSIKQDAQRKDALTSDIRRIEEEVKRKEGELEAFRNKTRDIDIRTKEIEYKRGALREKILHAYKVDIAAVNIEMDEGEDWQAIARKIEELKAQIEKMGEVSLGAVEEHKQLEERFYFLTKQRDDLERGRESLLAAITKINRTTRKMFMETFEAIRKEFNEYFRMLLNGGKAELVLEDESNILECGIDIIVRPPGKKLHNIMQLSGGEKAMTAIALIFAIFKVNPSPFCILDEIDAPLDESNIVRFCSVLQEFLRLSQFVIVTHNRMTIQLADVLYGITMEEKGVTKIVSVKFSEEKENPADKSIPVTA